MVTVEEVLLKHMTDYDPAAAREYYLRNRQLKGRQAAAQKPILKRGPAAAKPLPTKKVAGKVVPIKKVAKKAPPGKSAAQLRKEVDAKVASLKGRLEALQKELAALVKQAKARSGVKTPAKKLPTNASASKPPSKSTSKEKAAAAKASQKYRDGHKTEKKPSEDVASLEAKIAAVKEKILEMKAQLAKAQQEATKRKSSSVGARAKTNK